MAEIGQGSGYVAVIARNYTLLAYQYKEGGFMCEPNWADVGSLVISFITMSALAVTLLYLCKYTKDTRIIAKMSVKEHRKRTEPVVSVFLDLAKETNEVQLPKLVFPNVRVTFDNPSDNHALVAVTVKVVTSTKALPPVYEVSGQKNVYVSARSQFLGHFSLREWFTTKLSDLDREHLLKEYGKPLGDSETLLYWGVITHHCLEDDHDFDIGHMLISQRGIALEADVCYRRWPISDDEEPHPLPKQRFRMYMKVVDEDRWSVHCVPDGVVIL